MTQFTRHIQVEGGYNIRDLGGYPTQDGRVTKERRLIRAGNLHQLTPQAQKHLLDYGVTTIIDLRHVSELELEPDVFAAGENVRYFHLSYASDTFDPQPADVTLSDLYCRSLGVYQTNIAAILTTIAESEPGVLYHCAVGKDRTGMISALLLGLAGVPAEVIAEDYAETTRHIVPMVERWREWTVENGGDMELFERVVSSNASTMLTTLEHIEHQYGGVAEYLNTCGITAQQIDRLRALLLDE